MQFGSTDSVFGDVIYLSSISQFKNGNVMAVVTDVPLLRTAPVYLHPVVFFDKFEDKPNGTVVQRMVIAGVIQFCDCRHTTDMKYGL